MYKKNNVFVLLIAMCIFIGCSEYTKKNTSETGKNHESTDTILSWQDDNSFNLETISDNRINTITDFFFNEVMIGNDGLGFHRNKYGVVELFGDPLKIIVTPVSFEFAGGMVVEFHEYIYDSFTHYYYIFEDGGIFYVGFSIKKNIEQLRTIKIGDTVDQLLSTFYDTFFINENTENIRYYIDSTDWEIIFIIKDTIIQRIHVNILFG